MPCAAHAYRYQPAQACVITTVAAANTSKARDEQAAINHTAMHNNTQSKKWLQMSRHVQVTRSCLRSCTPHPCRARLLCVLFVCRSPHSTATTTRLL